MPLESDPKLATAATPASASPGLRFQPAAGAPPESSNAGGVKLQILVVDDEPSLREVIRQVLVMEGHEVTVAASGEEALARFRETPFPLVITDVIMGGMTGLDLLNEIHVLAPETLVVIMTSQASLEVATRALRGGAYDFLVKPFDDLILISALAERATDKLQLQLRNRLLTQQLAEYTGELERLTRHLKERADRDGSTGLYNVRYFRTALDGAIAEATAGGPSFAVILLDVDHFKHYNDTHGHLAGDDVLKDLAQILQQCSRSQDVCARYGGEEFVVLVRAVSQEAALAQAERLRAAVESHAFAGRETQPHGKVTISVGVAVCPADGADAERLIDRADTALYQAKRKGRNAVHY